MSASEQVLGGYSRVHVALDTLTLPKAAAFITSSLLVSHGIRRESAAIARIAGDRWIAAYGDTARHLRPDIDTALGWVRAVLRGSMRLGGRVIEPDIVDTLLRENPVCVTPCHGDVYAVGDSIKSLFRGRIVVVYTRNCRVRASLCKSVMQVCLPVKAFPELASAIVNVILDRTSNSGALRITS